MTHPQTIDAEDVQPEDQVETGTASAEPRRDDDARSDIEQAVAARADAVERGEGGSEPEPMINTGDYSGVSGDGGEVKNQDINQQ